jgi:hypothetical protein
MHCKHHCNHRNCDPPTSALAGRHMQACGLAHHQREMCLAVVRHHPGLTAREIEARIGIKAHKRLPELRADGQVRNGPSRPCTVSGRMAMTWLMPEYLN